MTYPEISDFIKKYIAGTNKLPVKEYFEKLGIDYTENAGYDSSKIGIGFGIGFANNKFVVTNVGPQNAGKIQQGDILYKFNGEEITLQNIQQTAAKINTMKVGDKLNFVVIRNDEEIPVEVTVLPRAIRHVFKLAKNPTPEQLALRNAWSQNFMNYKAETESH
jgi:predicted metalloprotease with PDZ domain